MPIRFRCLLTFVIVILSAVPALQAGEIIPMPVSTEMKPGAFSISPGTKILWTGDSCKATAEFLSAALKDRTGLDLATAEKTASMPTDDTIDLEQTTAGADRPALDGNYALTISPKAALISADNADGVFYGAISLVQLAGDQATTSAKAISIPAQSITDQPRYQWRGLMVDESRHFFGKKAILSVLDTMAYLKMNRFHWHLTDEDAWRIEIKKYPLLTTTGAIGNRSDPDAPPLFYTQDEIREIVAHATALHIMVIPEIDMPGHMAAVSRAYPELSGGGNGFTINPGKEETYTFCTDVLTEIAPLFPGPYLHIGGDEVNFGNKAWAHDPAIVKFAADHGMPDTLQLEKYFAKRMSDVVHKLGKTTAAWDDAAPFIGNQNTLLMWWHDKHPEKMLENDDQVVLCPHLVTYFNSRQNASHQVLAKRPVTDMAIVYAFPESMTKGIIPPGKEADIAGVQACLWSEFVGDPHRLDYMLYPRLAAMAEDAWTPLAMKNYDGFMKRIPAFLKELDRRGINYYNPFDPASTPEPAPPKIMRVVSRGHVDNGLGTPPATAPK